MKIKEDIRFGCLCILGFIFYKRVLTYIFDFLEWNIISDLVSIILMIIIVVPAAAVTAYWLNKLITNYIRNLGK